VVSWEWGEKVGRAGGAHVMLGCWEEVTTFVLMAVVSYRGFYGYDKASKTNEKAVKTICEGRRKSRRDDEQVMILPSILLRKASQFNTIIYVTSIFSPKRR